MHVIIRGTFFIIIILIKQIVPVFAYLLHLEMPTTSHNIVFNFEQSLNGATIFFSFKQLKSRVLLSDVIRSA